MGLCAAFLSACAPTSESAWLLVDNFEGVSLSPEWTVVDTDNQTDPFVENPQVHDIRREAAMDNHYLLKKPAEDGVVGNRKAISFHPLPMKIAVGETATLYTRVFAEYFPNNHSFGLSNLGADEIPAAGYDAFEPMIRITDKAESDGTKNDGTLMVLSGYKTYAKILGASCENLAEPMRPGTWYEIWTVVMNSPKADRDGGQTYDLYVRGGEFTEQTRVFLGATFRMKREAPLTHFMTISNTGSKKSPYGNGGVGYDDIYIAPGRELSSPLP